MTPSLVPVPSSAAGSFVSPAPGTPTAGRRYPPLPARPVVVEAFPCEWSMPAGAEAQSAAAAAAPHG